MVWVEKIRKSLKESGYDIRLEEIDVTENPKSLDKYSSRVWQEFFDGYTHYVTIVAVNGKTLEDWYWDIQKIIEEVKHCFEVEKTKET
jgi:hypothetical protein